MNACLQPRGFIALFPVLMLGTTLLAYAAAAGQDAFEARRIIVHAENGAAADAAARSCVMSIALRLAQDELEPVTGEMSVLGDGRSCHLDEVHAHDDRYEVTISVQVREARVRWRANVYHVDGAMSDISWRKI